MIVKITENNIGYEIENEVAKLIDFARSSWPPVEKMIVPSYVNGHPVRVIGATAFWPSCFKEVVLPETIKIIENRAFYKCKDLEKINFPKSLTDIGRGAFADCHSLSSLTIPGTVGFDAEAFCSCSNLKTVKLKEGQLIIPDASFAFCGIEDLYLPDSLYTISETAFDFVPDDMVVHCHKGTFAEEWAMEHNFKIDYDKTQLSAFLEEVVNSNDTNIIK